MSDERPGEMRIGQVLEQARARAGLEIADVEERTKIRAKYLRALESEDWGELPSPAYAKGFLRTYSQLLGLDSDALVDEYRRQVESDLSEPAYPLGDQVLERRRRPGAGGARRSRAWIFVVLAALAVGRGRGGDRAHQRRRAEARRKAGRGRERVRTPPRAARGQRRGVGEAGVARASDPRAGRGLPARRRRRGADRRPGAARRRPGELRAQGVHPALSVGVRRRPADGEDRRRQAPAAEGRRPGRVPDHRHRSASGCSSHRDRAAHDRRDQTLRTPPPRRRHGARPCAPGSWSPAPR